jgi:mRNA interferase RelE/StbE
VGKRKERAEAVTYRIALTPTAREQLRSIKDLRVRQKLAERIDALAEDPELQGKPLQEELSGYRSVRAVGQRYRIIFHVERKVVTVFVVALGRRSGKDKADIYELTKKLIHLGLIDVPKRKL